MDKLFMRGVAVCLASFMVLGGVLAGVYIIGMPKSTEQENPIVSKAQTCMIGPHYSAEFQYVFDESLVKDEPKTEPKAPAAEAPSSSWVFENEDVAEEEYYDDTPQYGSGGTYLGVFRCTAYCPCYYCSEGYGRSTSTGAVARANHTIAVDPNVIPYGSHVLIDGIVYTAEDCGGGVNGNSIDVFFDTHEETYGWGLRYLDVYLLD